MALENHTAAKIVRLPDKLTIGLIGHDKSICDLMRELLRRGFSISGVETFRKERHEKDKIEWTGYLMERGLYESVLDFARLNHIDILEIDNPNNTSSINWFLRKGVNLVLSCGCHWVLNKGFLGRFSYRVVNFHPSMLPEYGGGPAQTWQVLNNETRGGWTAHWVDCGIDRGGIVCQIEYPVKPGATPLEILKLRHKNSKPFFNKFVSMLKTRSLPKIKPDFNRRTYFYSLYTPRDARIDFSWEAKYIERFVRAFGFPYAGAFGLFRKSSGEIIKVRISKVKIINQDFKTEFHPFVMGNILRHTDDGGALVNLQKGLIKISKVRDGPGEINASYILKLGGRFLNGFQD